MEQLQGGGRFSDPVREAMESQGSILQRLAPFYGFGTPVDEGGAGNDFADFYRQRTGQMPSFGERSGLLRDISGANTANPLQQTPQQSRLADLFGGQANPHDFVADLLTAGSNPYMRGVLSSGIQRRSRAAEATNPQTPFLQFLQTRGYF